MEASIEYRESSKLAEVLLPELVWEKVLENLIDPIDTLNAGKVCTLFERLTRPNRPACLFIQAFPLLFNHLDKSTILTCRLLSKRITSSINTHLAEIFSLQAAKFYLPINTFICPYEFRNAPLDPPINNDCFQQFINKFPDHPHNPIVGGTVRLRITTLSRPYWETHLELIYNFLSKFGQHINTLRLSLLFENDSEETLKFQLKNLFKFAPNLKTLIIRGNFPIISSLTIPTNLIHLNVSTIDENVELDLMKCVAQTMLKVLVVNRVKNLVSFQWPNLKELRVNSMVKFRKGSYSKEEERDDYFYLPLLNAPKLETLDLNISHACFSDNYQGNVWVHTFKVILDALTILSKSSTNLSTLRFPRTKLWDANNNILLWKRPSFNIKRLEIQDINKWDITFGKNVADYSFLLFFPGVEEILIWDTEIWVGEKADEMFETERVQVNRLGYQGKMYDSNIWEMIPSLKTFTFGKRKYSRECYERIKAKQMGRHDKLIDNLTTTPSSRVQKKKTYQN